MLLLLKCSCSSPLIAMKLQYFTAYHMYMFFIIWDSKVCQVLAAVSYLKQGYLVMPRLFLGSGSRSQVLSWVKLEDLTTCGAPLTNQDGPAVVGCVTCLGTDFFSFEMALFHTVLF